MKGTLSQVSAGKANLLRLADLLDTADERHRAAGEPQYCQSRQSHDCGTPACALAHWYAQHGRPMIDADPTEVELEFALDAAEARELFGSSGCGNAGSARAAAAYLRQFVDRADLTVPADFIEHADRNDRTTLTTLPASQADAHSVPGRCGARAGNIQRTGHFAARGECIDYTSRFVARNVTA